jgi:hypothetical protein
VSANGVETALCPSCGGPLGEASSCPRCAPPDSSVHAPFLEGPAQSPEDDRAFGLVLFEAEECLARGSGEKALVLASRAVK